jgi:ABC-type multidrug transport system fused ATPase/permease subunit
VARALLAQSQILLLDDCTSALDAETDERVNAALDDLLLGLTKIIVSVEAASLRNADWVILLEERRIVKQGRPMELFAKDASLN